MQVACFLIEHFPYHVEVQRRPSLRRRPVLIVQHRGSQRVVTDHAPEVTAVSAGMPLQKALARCRDAVLLEADQARYQTSFDELLDALEQRSPVVEPAGLGRVHIGLDGLASMYGGEARLITNLLSTVPQDFQPRIGVATAKFGAYVAALRARPGGALKAPQPLKGFLADVSVDLLSVPWKVMERLHSFGLHTLKDVAAIGVGPLQAQFGPEGRRMWELACGQDSTPLISRKHEEVLSASLSFPTPTASLEAIITAADSLMGRLFGQPAMRGRFVRVCMVEGEVFRASRWQRRIGFREPVGDKARAFFVLKHVLGNHPPPGPLEDLGLTFSGLTGESGRQESLWAGVRRQEQLRDTIRHLEARLGKKPPIYQVREVEPWSRIPERRQALVPYVP